MNLEVGDVVMCTVDRIVGTVVFVKIDLGNKEVEGSIIMSEVAPGRIRNLRDYVVPKKKIVCKVLRISSGGNIDLSLRRVTGKERKEVLEQQKQERSYVSVLKSMLGSRAEEVIEKIKQEGSIYDFLEEAKRNPEKFEKIVGKDEAKKIIEVLKEQKQKAAIIRKDFSLTTTDSGGLHLIKKILSQENIKDAEVKYVSAGRYSIKAEADDLKAADHKLRSILSEIEKAAKNNGMEFSIKEK